MSSNLVRLLSLGICILFATAGSGLQPNVSDAQDRAGMPGLTSYSALPSADPDDGKFLGIAGENLSTLAGRKAVAFVGVPAGETSFQIGIFDGDQGTHWDTDGYAVTIYKLYKDPLKNGSTSQFVTSWTSDDCIDDDWYNKNFSTDSGAKAPSGNYFYRLEVDWRDYIPEKKVNNFKIRTTGQISLMAGQWFGFDGGPQRIYSYPLDPCVGEPGNSYDGEWCFSFYVPTATNRVEFWDGDSDRAGDTDDPNTPPPEGVSEGSPKDGPSGHGDCCNVDPSIYNLVVAPSPSGYYTFTNTNPSGNAEEEMFSIGDLPTDDWVVNFTLLPGLWKYKVMGMDAHNFNFLKATYEIFACGDDPPLPVNPPPEVEPDHTIVVDPDGTYFFNHTAKNRGASQTYDLIAVSSHNWDTRIYEDLDQDGVYDSGEPEVDETGLLTTGEVFYMLVSVDVPSGTNGVIDHVDITASSQIEWAIQDSALDVIQVKSNQPPEATAGGPYIGFEGSPVTLDGSGSSDPDGDPLEYRWDLDGDGSWDTGYSSSPTYTHTWDDDWTGTVILEVTDGEETDGDSANVTIFNVAPTPEWTSRSSDGTMLSPPYPEGKEIIFEATVSDPGIYDTFTYDWDFGDGTILLDAGPSVTHTYGDDDVYIVVLTVTDDDGGVGIDDTPPLDTTNENPVASIDMPFCIFSEGTYPCEAIGQFADPGWLDTHSAVWDYGDGTYETAVLMEENDPPDATGMNITSHIYGDNGVYNLSFTVVDDDGGVGTAWAEAQVINLPPTLDVDIPASVDEGREFGFSITATDPGSDDIIIGIDWGDGTSEAVTHYNNGIGPDPPNSGQGTYPFTVWLNSTHVYGDNGNFTVGVTVEDDDGGSAEETLSIEVLNLPPGLVFPRCCWPVNESEPAGVSFGADDPGSDDLTVSWTFELGPSGSETYFNDGVGPDPKMSPWGTFPFYISKSLYHRYGDNGFYNLTIIVEDDDGGVVSTFHMLKVINLPPSVEIQDAHEVDENTPVEFHATASDPGSDDLTFIWNWGDGTTDTVTFYNDGIGPDPPMSPWGTFPFNVPHTMSHVWGDNGDFTVTLTVTDDDGGFAVQQTVVTVNNVAPTVEGIAYYLNASLAFRIAGEKWHNVEIHLYEDGNEIGYANITRYPGSPNDQMVTLADISIDFSKTYSAVAYYTPEDDPINGQIWGATPAWVILEYEDGSEWIHHTFNVRHEDTWTWVIDDFSPYFLGHNITFVATASDPGSDDLTFTWDWGDGNTTENVYYNDGIGPDPYPSPEVNPITATDTVKHGHSSAGTYVITLTVTDDDGGTQTIVLLLAI